MAWAAWTWIPGSSWLVSNGFAAGSGPFMARMLKFDSPVGIERESDPEYRQNVFS